MAMQFDKNRLLIAVYIGQIVLSLYNTTNFKKNCVLTVVAFAFVSNHICGLDWLY